MDKRRYNIYNILFKKLRFKGVVQTFKTSSLVVPLLLRDPFCIYSKYRTLRYHGSSAQNILNLSGGKSVPDDGVICFLSGKRSQNRV